MYFILKVLDRLEKIKNFMKRKVLKWKVILALSFLKKNKSNLVKEEIQKIIDQLWKM